MGDHIDENGKFRSDKFTWCKPGFVPLKLTDPMAQPVLWTYAGVRASVDQGFCDDLRTCLLAEGYKPPAVAEDVTAMLEEVARLDAVLPGPRWSRVMATDGERLSDGTGYIGDDYQTRHIETAPCAENDGESEPVIEWCESDEIADFVVLARTALPALAKALEASEQGSRMLREDHDNGVALLRKAEAEIETLRTERDGWKVEAVGAKRLADLRQITKEEAEQRADAVEAKLEALRKKARAVWEDTEESEEASGVGLVGMDLVVAMYEEASRS